MKRTLTNSILAGLMVIAVSNTGTAIASDDRMWREHVADRNDTATILVEKSVGPTKKLGNNSLPWREQIQAVTKNRVFFTEPTSQRYAETSDTRFWREHVKSNRSARISKTPNKVVASKQSSKSTG